MSKLSLSILLIFIAATCFARRTLNNFPPAKAGPVTCANNANVRLVGGATSQEGRLEMHVNGLWSSVCPDNWSATNAAVVCAELCGGRREYATSVPASILYGLREPFRVRDTKCLGGERSITSCSRNEAAGSGAVRCSEDTGVGLCCHSGCDGRNLFLSPKLRYKVKCEVKSYTVSVERQLTAGVLNTWRLFPENEPTCDNATHDTTTTHNIITVPYEGNCNPIADGNETATWWRQNMIISSLVHSNGVTRAFSYRLPITCGVIKYANGTVDLDSSQIPPIIDPLPPADPQFDKIAIAIKVYKKPDFTDLLPQPITNLPIGTPIYVRIETDPAKFPVSNTRIVVDKCIVYPIKNDPTTRPVTILENATAAEDSVAVLPTEKVFQFAQFKFQTFKVDLNSVNIYMTCWAVLCVPTDGHKKCTSAESRLQHGLPPLKLQLGEMQSEAAPAPPAKNLELQEVKFEDPDMYRCGMTPDGERLFCDADSPRKFVQKKDGTIRLFYDPANPAV